MEKSIVAYTSLRDFHADCPKPGSETGHSMSDREQWSGNQSYKEAHRNLFQGMPDAVKRSDALLEQLESDGLVLNTTHWETDVVGFIPSIPDFLAGSPECMYAPLDIPSDTSPMRVFASVCLSGGFSEEDLEKRGVAILALVRRLSMIRPVELWIYSDQEGKQPMVRLETSPLDLTTASYALANPAFLRKLCFAWGYDKRGFHGSWANWGGRSDMKTVTKALGANPQDLIITGSYLGKADLTDPVKWINDQLKKYAQTADDYT